MKKEATKKIVRKEFEIKFLSDDCVLPIKAKRGSIGYDLTVPRDFIVPAHCRCKVPMDFAINLPAGTEAKIEPRSGCSLKGIPGFGTKKIFVKKFGFIPWRKTLNGALHFDCDVLVGKIDPNYTDNVHVLLKNNDESFVIRAGTRIAQMTFYYTTSPFFRIVDELTAKSRCGGFGSSGTGKIIPPKPNVESEEANEPESTDAAAEDALT